MTTLTPSGYRLAEAEGQRIWFLGTLMTVKAGQVETSGAFTLLEQLTPPGFAAPRHVHDAEDEAFYVLEGQLQVNCGDATWTVSQGGFVLLPRTVPHAFTVLGEQGAKLLQITSPADFEQFAAEAGEAAISPTLPPPAEPNIPKLLAAMARHHKRMA